MAAAKVDWGYLQGALGVFAVCVLVSGGLVGGSLYFREAMYADFARYQGLFREASRRYLAVDEEERMLREHLPRFVELYNLRILGREDRLNWIEVLRYAGHKVKMPALRYRIDTQSAYAPPFAVPTGVFQVFASPMKLELGLVHEGDFLALLDELDKRANGLYSVSRCSFARLAGAPADPQRANLDARCELAWFTVNLPGEGLVLK